jgi:hypothetical protein
MTHTVEGREAPQAAAGIHPPHRPGQGHRLVRGSWIHQHQAFGEAPRVDVPGGVPAAVYLARRAAGRRVSVSMQNAQDEALCELYLHATPKPVNSTSTRSVLVTRLDLAT